MRALTAASLATLSVILLPSRGHAGELPSCEDKIASYVDDANAPGADLQASDYAAVLDRGSYLNECGVPSDMSVKICAAVQGGKAIGVTVSTTPADEKKTECIREQIAALEFPVHPKMDVARTTFAAAVEDSHPAFSETPVQTPPAVEQKRSGCACSVPAGTDGAWSAPALLVGCLALWRRRARH